MGMIIEQTAVVQGTWRSRHSALRLAVSAAKTCLDRAQRSANDLDLVLNAGLYRDRNLGEPALAALIQEDIGAHPEDPHVDTHGTFSFDVANGTCGILTALQIADGFLRSGAIKYALIVASDADPGHGMSDHFPFSAAGGALLCSWADSPGGMGAASWAGNRDGDALRARIQHERKRNVLHIEESAELDTQYAETAATAVATCLSNAALGLADIDRIVAAPARPRFRAALAEKLGLEPARITVAPDEWTHTAALVAAFEASGPRPSAGTRTLVVTAGAGVTAGAALYEEPA